MLKVAKVDCQRTIEPVQQTQGGLFLRQRVAARLIKQDKSSHELANMSRDICLRSSMIRTTRLQGPVFDSRVQVEPERTGLASGACYGIDGLCELIGARVVFEDAKSI